ncbi:putative 2OG-Fe(II) oxygenase [Sphingomonas segetis]|uniref:putative 2OG-Fe(II) oxygenase n=1 Tax=Sphingomonas segetis TaxID=1104779 RepID=UPI0012D33828|nr:putative 2OG-Fe(II) oxygenase [Sphingomonas segetis]
MAQPITAGTADAALFREATEAWDRGEAETVLPKLERALPRSGDYRLWHIHGLILRQLERHGEALESLARAVELAPAAPNPAHALARALYEAGLPSVDAYARAVRLAPGTPEITLGLAAALVAERRVDDAIAGLERSLSFTPQWTDGHVQLAKLRWMQGERTGFTRSFDDAIARLPRSLDLRREQIIALVHAEQWDDALRAIDAGRAALGPHFIFDANEAAIHSETGEVAQADALFQRLGDVPDASVQLRRVRHELRNARPEIAGFAIDPWLQGPQAFLFWPYASIAWRMTGDPRSEWLEGDPRLVGVYDIADRLPPLDELADTLRQLHTVRAEPLEQSLRGGTQTDGNLFQRVDPLIVQLREAIRATVAEHVAQLPTRDERHPLLGPQRAAPIRFNGAWSVRLSGGGYHANHVHPLGWISSALYVVLPPDLGQGEAGFLTLGEPQAQLRLDMPPVRLVEPKPGRLALFPSWMWHGTRPFGEGERMTVAFDVAVPA